MTVETGPKSTKPSGALLLLSEVQEVDENGPLMASIREGLEVRYGTKAGKEIAAKPAKVLIFSDATRQRLGINALVLVGEEASALNVKSSRDSGTGRDCFLFQGSDRIILFSLSGKLRLYGNGFANGIDYEYSVERVYRTFGSQIATEFKGVETLTDRSMVVAVLPTHDLRKKLLNRCSEDRKIKMPDTFLWIDNQFPQAPETPTTPVA